jgi:hypothetical protein
MFQWFMIAALVVLALLGWSLVTRLAADRIQLFSDRRRSSSRLVSLGEFIDGSRHIPVALALTQSTFYYENSDMQACLDLHWIHEVEYEDELATGQTVAAGKVLRLRCFSQTFEFVLPIDVVQRWQALLPPRRISDPAGLVAAGSLAPTTA